MSEPTDHEPSAQLADLLRALSQTPRASEVSDAADAVAAMQSAIASAGVTEGALMTRKRKRAHIAVLAAAGVLVVGGAAAAGFDPTDRPPQFDAPPATVPPVELPDQARGDEHAGPPSADETTTTTIEPTTTTTTTVAETTTTVAETTTTDETTTTVADTTTIAPAPGEVVCADGNHGETVSSVAHAVPPGPEHGPAVAAAAHSDCGKEAAEDDGTEAPETEAPETETTESGAAEQASNDEHGRPEDAGRPDDVPGRGRSGR